VLKDRDKEERRMGIEAGFAFRAVTSLTAVYVDLGMTPGMEAGILDAQKAGRKVETRALGGNWAATYAELLKHFA
jgi:hypothetical protein